MDDKKNIWIIFYENTKATFLPSILTFSFLGWLLGQIFGEHIFEPFGVYILGGEGLAYKTIAQILALSIILGALLTIFVSDTFFTKIMLLWRCVIFIFFSLVTLCLFVIIFQWFPVDRWEAWMFMSLFFILFFMLGTLPMFIKTRLADRRYEKLLSEYKSNKKD